MKRIAAIAVIAAIGIGTGSAAYAGASPAPKAAQNEPVFDSAHWDDDDDDDRFDPRRQVTPMPVPDGAAIRRAGIVQVTEVERDDGRIEVEGFDAQGREIKLTMDRAGKRVLSSRIDRDRDD